MPRQMLIVVGLAGLLAAAPPARGQDSAALVLDQCRASAAACSAAVADYLGTTTPAALAADPAVGALVAAIERLGAGAADAGERLGYALAIETIARTILPADPVLGSTLIDVAAVMAAVDYAPGQAIALATAPTATALGDPLDASPN